MTIHVDNIDDGSVEEFLDTVNLEQLLSKFDVLEADEYTEYGEKTVYKNDALHSPILSEGCKLVSLMNQQFEEVNESTKSLIHSESNYGVAA